MYATWSSYSAAIALSILSLVACTRLSARLRQQRDDPRRLLGLFVAIATGVMVLFSPLDELSDRYFSAHMVEHELLLFTMPLAVLAAHPLPLAVIMPWRLAPSQWRRSFGKGWNGCRKFFGRFALFLHPFPALVLSTLALWLWHVPVLYGLALENEWMHALEHLSFLVIALIYWQPLLGGRHAARLNSNPKRALYLIVFGMQGGLLGGLIALHSRIIYFGYLEQPGASLHSAFVDQQIGGAIMWFSGPIFCAVIAALALE